MPELFPAIPIPARVNGFAWVYILQTADGALYIGQTHDLTERLRKHRYGLGSKFTSDHFSPRLVFHEGSISFDAAVRREAQLKRWSRAKKEALIRGDLHTLRMLSHSRGASPSPTWHQYPQPSLLAGSRKATARPLNPPDLPRLAHLICTTTFPLARPVSR